MQSQNNGKNVLLAEPCEAVITDEYFSEYLLKSVSIILILCTKVLCKQNVLLLDIYFNILKGLRCLLGHDFC